MQLYRPMNLWRGCDNGRKQDFEFLIRGRVRKSRVRMREQHLCAGRLRRRDGRGIVARKELVGRRHSTDCKLAGWSSKLEHLAFKRFSPEEHLAGNKRPPRAVGGAVLNDKRRNATAVGFIIYGAIEWIQV